MMAREDSEQERVYKSTIANVVVASGETVGDTARSVGDSAGEAVTRVCEGVKEICPHAVLNCPPLTRNGKMEMTLRGVGVVYQACGTFAKAGIRGFRFITGSKVKKMATNTALKTAANVIDKDIVPACREAREMAIDGVIDGTAHAVGEYVNGVSGIVGHMFGAGGEQGCKILLGKCMEVNMDVMETAVRMAI